MCERETRPLLPLYYLYYYTDNSHCVASAVGYSCLFVSRRREYAYFDDYSHLLKEGHVVVQCHTRFVGRVSLFFLLEYYIFHLFLFLCLSSPADAKPLLAAYLFHLMLHLFRFSCSSLSPPPSLSQKNLIVDTNPPLFSNEPSHCRSCFLYHHAVHCEVKCISTIC